MSANDLTLVVGLGKTGIATVRYCLQHGLSVAVTDSREDPPGLEELQLLCHDIEVVCGEISPALAERATTLIVSPGVSLKEPVLQQVKAAGKTIIGDVELFARLVKAPVVAVTGSNGKSTVVSMLNEMAQQAGLDVVLAGNVGLPVLDVAELEPDLFILELSSFQLETTHSLKPKAAAILNITEDHMDRYADFAEYVQAKQRIYLNAEQAVFNRQDANTYPPSGQGISFGVNEVATGFGIKQEFGKAYLCHDGESLIAETELSLSGYHAVLNALACMAIASVIDLPQAAVLSVLRNFAGLAHRCELVKEEAGVTWYNDSKATNVGACVAALKTLAEGKNIILIAGGDAKGAKLTPLQQPFADYVKKLIVLGQDGDAIAACAAEGTEVQRVNDLEAAVKAAEASAWPGDVVLLSPACASTDMFQNFQKRGELFTRLAKGLAV